MRKSFIQFTGIGLFLSLVLLPILAGILYAFVNSVGMAGGIQTGFTGEYWLKALQNKELYISLGYSFVLALSTLFLSVSLANLLVWFFLRNLTQGLGAYLPYFPLAVPGIVAGFVSFQVLSGAGWLARIAFHLGFIASPDQFPSMVQDQYAVGIIFTHTILATPFFMLLLLNLYKSERLAELQSLAETLGANARQRFWRIFVPVLWRSSRSVVLLYFIFLMGSYEIPLLLGRSSPRMISVLIVEKLQRFDLNEIPIAYIYALIYIAFVWSILLIFNPRKSKLA